MQGSSLLRSRAVLLFAWLVLPLALPGALRAQDVRTDLYVTNGVVNAAVESDGVLYIGGAFTSVGPPTGGALPLDEATGLPLAMPGVAGAVYAIVPDGSGGWFIGGDFTYVGTAGRSNLAHLLADHTVSSWDTGADGIVSSLLMNGDTLFVGGSFVNIGGEPVSYLAAVSATTGNVLAGWDAAATGKVSSMVLAGGVLYVGGAFAGIGGQTRSNIAALDPATASATAWDPGANGTVMTLAAAGGVVYAGGAFSFIGGQSRNHLAALDVATGEATSWNPDASDVVDAIAPNGGTVYVGGAFVDIGGQSRNHIAALDAGDAHATGWDPNVTGTSLVVRALAVENGVVYAGGTFTQIGGAPRNNAAAIDTTSGAATSWIPNLNRSVYTLAVEGGTVYAGGEFTSNAGLPRRNLAALDLTSGEVRAWNPGATGLEVNALATDGTVVFAGGSFTSVGGQPRNNIAAVSAAGGVVLPWDPSADDRVRVLVLDGSTLYAGGDFLNIGGQFRNYLAALDTGSGNATAWDPAPDGAVRALLLRGTTLYAGGAFGQIGGQFRSKAGAVDVGTALATTWDPNASSDVFALCSPQGARIYVGGDFSSIGGAFHDRVAAVDPVTGLDTGWDAGVSGTRVYAIAKNGSTVYLGGSFTAAGGEVRGGLAAVDATSGLAHLWDAKTQTTAEIRTLVLEGTRVYAGGNFLSMVGRPQAFVAGIDQSLAITSVAPSSASNTGSVSLSILGIGFQGGSVPMLTRAGQSDIIGAQVEVSGAGTIITATFDLNGALLGAWNVVVVNPDMTFATLKDGFTVEPPLPQQLRVDVVAPPLIRANHPTTIDIVIQNLSNSDVLTVPLWISRLPAEAVVALGMPVSSVPQGPGEPDWSLAPLTLGGTAGRYLALVVPRVPPGVTVRRLTLTLPAEVTTFELDAAVAPPWVNGTAFRNCLYGGEAIADPGCVGNQLDVLNAYMTSTSGLAWVNGIGLWAKIAWKCDGAGSMAAALERAEQALDYMAQPVEMAGLPSGCEVALVPRWQARRKIGVVTSVDPNEKVGPDGYGEEQEIGSGQILPYSIRFENLDTATAPAQNVVVIDAINGDALDLGTVTLGPVAFGEHVVYPPPGLNSYSTDVDLRPGEDLIVRVAATFDPATGVLSWGLSSIDPDTGLPPVDPLTGFLPPNVTPPEGEGSMLFTVMPHPDLPPGGSISNSATIIFDGGTPIETDPWSNLLDGTPPASEVLPLETDQDSTTFTVAWEATGAPPDLRDFSVYVSENGDEYRAWRIHTTATADTFSGSGGRSYAFYSLARDSSGNLEKIPTFPDAETNTPVAVGEPGGPLRLALAGAIPNPVLGEARVWFTLPDRERALLEVIDVTGRRVWGRDVGTLGPGRHVVDVGAAARRPGLYFVRLARRGEVLRARMVVLR